MRRSSRVRPRRDAIPRRNELRRSVWSAPFCNELGASHGTVRRSTHQLDCDVESVRSEGRETDIDDGPIGPLTITDKHRTPEFELENKEQRR